MSLGKGFESVAESPDTRVKKTITYERGKGPKVRPEDCVTDEGLRFDPSVPIKTFRLPALEVEGLSESEYELIDTKKSYRLAQRPASYLVLCYEQPVYKLKETKRIVNAIMVSNVLDRSVADVSFLVGLMVDKFLYHGQLFAQPRLRNGLLLDDYCGYQSVLLTRQPLDLQKTPNKLVHCLSGDEHPEIADALNELNVIAALIRPDRYILATVDSDAGMARLINAAEALN